MKIVIVSASLSEKMGYSISFLPKALAELGHEVHLVTSNTQVYFGSPDYKDIFERFIGPGVVECCVRPYKGFTLHRLPYRMGPRRALGIRGLIGKIKEINPDIVHSFGLMVEPTYELALAKPFFKYKLFAECHIHASVFPPMLVKVRSLKRWLYWRVYKLLCGKLLNATCELCIAISTDAAQIAMDYFGLSHKKTVVHSLGTDTQMFKPWYECDQKARLNFRRSLGFQDDHIVCIYTGRLHEGKDPLILARAIDQLVKKGKPYRAIFVGDGPEEYREQLKKHQGCVFVPFVTIDELPQCYQAADIAVWPKQESTSQLDAASCGLPLILSDRVKVVERVNGNGLLYEENNLDDLISKLLQLQQADVRRKMGEVGVRNMREKFSWQKVAQGYIEDFERALKK
ncbi:MAG: glycosyltransferase family 4 protein [Candidatus Omnitrophota bacterium]